MKKKELLVAIAFFLLPRCIGFDAMDVNMGFAVVTKII
jgi:hypothetical protein